MTDDERTPDPERVILKLPRGAAVIFRNYGDPHRARTALQLRDLCHKRGILFLVANDAALAARTKADGVHLPHHMLRGLSRPRPFQLVTAAVHDEAELRSAKRANVDAVIVSPVFSTASHPGAKALDVTRFAALTAKATRPVYALGGITQHNAHRLIATKAMGIAAIGAFTDKD